jgi:osmotically inducible lipoprotein OsmB
MFKIVSILSLLGAAASLSACQGTGIECASMGAVGGALAAEVLDTNVAGGALIGGVAGATGNQTGLCTN